MKTYLYIFLATVMMLGVFSQSSEGDGYATIGRFRVGSSLRKRQSDGNGDGTYYTPGLGACGKTDYEPQLVCAMNAPDFGNHANSPTDMSPMCGKCLEVTGPKGKVVVTVVDKCPECLQGSVDLSETAFSNIADVASGRVKISWTVVPCSQNTVSTIPQTPVVVAPPLENTTTTTTTTTTTAAATTSTAPFPPTPIIAQHGTPTLLSLLEMNSPNEKLSSNIPSASSLPIPMPDSNALPSLGSGSSFQLSTFPQGQFLPINSNPTPQAPPPFSSVRAKCRPASVRPKCRPTKLRSKCRPKKAIRPKCVPSSSLTSF